MSTEKQSRRIYSSKIIALQNSRFLAVQSVYAWIMRKLEPNQLDAFLKSFFADPHLLHLSKLNLRHAIIMSAGAINYQPDLQQKLQQYLDINWRFQRLGKVMQSILLVAAYELSRADTPPKSVIINEYLEIAKLLNHEGETGFINKVLDQLGS